MQQRYILKRLYTCQSPCCCLCVSEVFSNSSDLSKLSRSRSLSKRQHQRAQAPRNTTPHGRGLLCDMRINLGTSNGGLVRESPLSSGLGIVLICSDKWWSCSIWTILKMIQVKYLKLPTIEENICEISAKGEAIPRKASLKKKHPWQPGKPM